MCDFTEITHKITDFKQKSTKKRIFLLDFLQVSGKKTKFARKLNNHK